MYIYIYIYIYVFVYVYVCLYAMQAFEVDSKEEVEMKVKQQGCTASWGPADELVVQRRALPARALFLFCICPPRPHLLTSVWNPPTLAQNVNLSRQGHFTQFARELGGAPPGPNCSFQAPGQDNRRRQQVGKNHKV